MKRILFFALFLAALQIQLIAQVERNTVWLKGLGPTSAPWLNAQSYAKQTLGYKLKVISDDNYLPHQDGVVGSANAMNLVINSGNFSDVLGIGHDGGGLTLRQMSKAPDSKLTAIILDGVPNQGSAALQKLLPDPSDPAGLSPVDFLINEVLAFKSNATNCNACQIVENFKIIANAVKANASKYREYSPNSSVIQNLGTPNIPYAVIWGNETIEDGLSLTRMLGSRAQSAVLGDDKGYLDCYQDELRDRKTAINNEALNRTLDNVLGLANTVSNFVVAAVVAGSGAPPPSSVGNVITGYIDAIFKQVKAVRAKDIALAEILECELVHQALNAQWSLLVSSTYTHYVGTYTYEIDGLDGCLASCEGEPDPQVYGSCVSDCYLYPPPPVLATGTYDYYTQEPHDGLLTQTEQSLPGAVKTYEAKSINHFQEQFFNYQQIEGPFVDLFNGNAGLAFKVPK